MITVVFLKNKMPWLFPTPSKKHIRIIIFILTALKNEQHSCKHVMFKKDGALEISIDVTNLLVYDFSILMEDTGGDASCINGK